jgi:hypothetical protein
MNPVLLDPTGTVLVTHLITYLVLFAATSTITYYTVLNARNRTIQSEMWQYVMFAGVVGALYAVTATAEVIAVAEILIGNSALLGAVRRVCQLFFIIFLALAMRELYYESPQQSTGLASRLPIESIRFIEAGFLFVVFTEFMIVILIGLVDIARIVQLGASIAFTVYGVSFAIGIKEAAMARRTVLDTMLTYIIAVMLCAGAASAVEVGVVVGLQPAIVEGTAIVLTIMSTTFLIVLTARLKQNVADVSI